MQFAKAKEDFVTGLSEEHFNVTIVNYTTKSLPPLSPSPDVYVVVACGDRAERIDTASPQSENNKTLSFTVDAGQDTDGVAMNLVVSLYRKRAGEKGEDDDALLGQSIEDLACLAKDLDITRLFPETESSVTFRIGKSRIYALIIGINDYPYLDEESQLHGCVADSYEMEDFLRNDLKVPKDAIYALRNEDATRQRILDVFCSHLLENKNIKYGDAIIIFYAGHGARIDAPPKWISPDNEIEAICPYDQNAMDEDGEYITGIPDRTINTLVRKLAEAKGNNIVLIFDSCHSGGIDRIGSVDNVNGMDELGGVPYKVRQIPNPRPLHGDVDRYIWEGMRGAHPVLPTGFRHTDMASHVLIAACKTSQRAFEVELPTGHSGWFSSRLIPKLREAHRSGELTSLTYLELIKQIPRLTIQTPQCIGKNKDSFLFTLTAPTKSRFHFDLVRSRSGGYEVALGSLHGIVHGTQFSIVQGSEKEHVVMMTAAKVYSRRSVLRPLTTDAHESTVLISPDAQATIWDWKNSSLGLNVFSDSEDVRQYASFTTGLHAGYTVHLVDSVSDAHVSISKNTDGKYEVERLPNFLSAYPDIKGETRGTGENLSDILTGICHFRYHIQRGQMTKTNIRVGSSATEGAEVKLHLYLLRWERERSLQKGLPYHVPMSSEDLFDSNCAAQLSFDKDVEDSYGVRITNDSATELFAYLFYFDPADYSIQEWFLPQCRTDAPLQPKRDMTIGYGANGGDPFAFDLEEGQTEGTGFLKLFVSSGYSDMTSIVQESPFASQKHHRTEPERPKPTDTTGSLVATITVISK